MEPRGRRQRRQPKNPPTTACGESVYETEPYTQMPVFVLPIRQEGFYAPRLCRRPISDPPSFGATFLTNVGQISSSIFYAFLSALQERFWKVLGAQVARRSCPRRSRRPPGPICGAFLPPQNGVCFDFFRASVAWCFSTAFAPCFV